MSRIAVFDSGLGSLSIIRSIQKFTKTEIIYYADQKNFPYGKKTKLQLKKIIDQTIQKLEDQFHPSLIIMASNTPSILFSNYLGKKIVGVLPPIEKALLLSENGRIGILGTKATIRSKELSRYLEKFNSERNFKKIDATELIKLVETGQFLTNPKNCKKITSDLLKNIFIKNKIDVVTLSSTHLPFLLPILEKEFPFIRFIDPADDVAKIVAKRIKKTSRNKLRIYTSLNPKILEMHIKKIGISKTVNFLP
ncbi:MAG: glutamate racemase [Candidatus Nitrosotenuis sp.]